MRDPCECATAEVQDRGSVSAEPPERLHLEIVNHDGDWRLFEPIAPAIEAAGQALTDVLSVPAGIAAVALSSDQHVQALNRAYRGEDKPTNVLSFPKLAPSDRADGAPPFLGDIVLAAQTVAREAAEQAKPPRNHLQHLVVHGLLHLHGYDHQTADEAEEMEALEVKILARLGIPDPYTESVAPTTESTPEKEPLSRDEL